MEGEGKYQGLHKISEVIRILAWVMVGLCGVGLLVGIGLAFRKPEAGGILCLVSVLYGVFGFIYLYTISQLILVILDIEANTRTNQKKEEQAG